MFTPGLPEHRKRLRCYIHPIAVVKRKIDFVVQSQLFCPVGGSIPARLEVYFAGVDSIRIRKS
jgi:hypothetical protein